MLVPDPPVIDAELRLQERLVEFVVTKRVTVPVNPLAGVIVIVELAEAVARAATVVGLALIEKSVTARETVVVRVRPPPVAVTVAM